MTYLISLVLVLGGSVRSAAAPSAADRSELWLSLKDLHEHHRAYFEENLVLSSAAVTGGVTVAGAAALFTMDFWETWRRRGVRSNDYRAAGFALLASAWVVNSAAMYWISRRPRAIDHRADGRARRRQFAALAAFFRQPITVQYQIATADPALGQSLIEFDRWLRGSRPFASPPLEPAR